MESAYPFVIAAVVVIALVAIFAGVIGRKGQSTGSKSGNEGGHLRQKNRNQIIHDATRKLSQDPHNPDALASLGDLYFSEHLWDKAYPLYDTLFKISSVHPEIDPFTAALRTGICAIKLDKAPEAIAALSAAYKINPHDFDVNYYIGLTCYKNQAYEQAIPCLRKALVLNNDAENIYFILGQSYYLANHYHESLAYLKHALDDDPQNKEALFDMADAMAEEGYGDKAMKVFMHLRPDPVFGARSCLSAGMIHAHNNDNEAAIQDFEIGLKHENTPVEIKIEIEYRLALSCFAINDIGRGIQELRKVQAMNPTYKDVQTLLSR